MFNWSPSIGNQLECRNAKILLRNYENFVTLPFPMRCRRVGDHREGRGGEGEGELGLADLTDQGLQ